MKRKVQEEEVATASATIFPNALQRGETPIPLS